MTLKAKLSGLDWQLLEVLSRDARCGISAIASKLGRSRSTITEHLKLLQDRAVITRFSARIDEDKLGVGISAFVRLQADSSQHRKIVNQLVEIPEVAECHVLTGDDLVMMRVVARDMPHLRSLVDGFTGWGATTTDVIFSTVKPELEINPALRRALQTQ